MTPIDRCAPAPRASAARPRPASAARHGRAVALAALAVLLLSVALALAACGAKDDPFAGLWWEPATGRRIEIRVADGSYKVVYGARKTPFPATRHGDELRVSDPLGGVSEFKQADGGMLTLTAAGKTSVLKPVPQHQ